MTIVANMRLGTCRARFRRGLGASQACLGRILAALGLLLASFWKHLDVSGAGFGAPGPYFLTSSHACALVWSKFSECDKTTVLMGPNKLRKPCVQRDQS